KCRFYQFTQCYFFFQAEDGIRDGHVTGVQTCALPIFEVTHERGPNTSGSWVWIDAFDIENGAPIPGGVAARGGHIEQDNPALVYTGHWFTNTNVNHSGGSAALATDAGARVLLRFNGIGIKW